MAAILSGGGSKMNNDIRAALLGDKEAAKRLTDEAVEMVMERLEELSNGKG